MLKALFQKFRRVILFGITGCINTLVDFGVFTVCSELLHWDAGPCQAAGYLSGVVCSFLLNKNITFRDGHGGRLGWQLLLFVIVNAVSLGASSLLIDLLTQAELNRYIAKLIVTLLSMCINYFGYKHLVFQIKENKEDMRDE